MTVRRPPDSWALGAPLMTVVAGIFSIREPVILRRTYVQTHQHSTLRTMYGFLDSDIMAN